MLKFISRLTAEEDQKKRIQTIRRILILVKPFVIIFFVVGKSFIMVIFFNLI
jgi:hypothetical protein